MKNVIILGFNADFLRLFQLATDIILRDVTAVDIINVCVLSRGVGVVNVQFKVMFL